MVAGPSVEPVGAATRPRPGMAKTRRPSSVVTEPETKFVSPTKLATNRPTG